MNGEKDNKIQLKWPNDLLVNGKKVSGILLENYCQNSFVDFAIIGIGINIANHPKNVLFEATSLFEENIKINKDDFLRIFLDEFDKLYELVNKFGLDETFKNIRKSWIKSAYRLQEEVRINLGDETISGIFEDIDEEGALMLRKDKQITQISFGDIC